MFNILGLYREHMKIIFLSETTRLKAFILDIWHHLIDIYQICSNYATGAKIALPQESHKLISEYCHAAYQIKWNKACNSILANILRVHTP